MLSNKNRFFAASLLVIITALTSKASQAEDSRIMGTGGVTQIEGAAGGGIVPWAVIASYAEDDEIGATSSVGYLSSDQFKLNLYTASVGIHNRYEFAISKQSFGLGGILSGNGLPDDIEQNIYSAKIKLFGDLIYDELPQVSFGIQHKVLDDFSIARHLGAAENSGTDYYLATSRLFLDGITGVPILTNLTVRSTSANQLGILGFGGERNSGKEFVVESNVSVFLKRNILFGIEYRQKPNNLLGIDENDWFNANLTWFYDKSIAATIAWADLGSIAGINSQKGLYFSVQITL